MVCYIKKYIKVLYAQVPTNKDAVLRVFCVAYYQLRLNASMERLPPL